MRYLITFMLDFVRFPWKIKVSIKKRHICPHIYAVTPEAQDVKDELGCPQCKLEAKIKKITEKHEKKNKEGKKK